MLGRKVAWDWAGPWQIMASFKASKTFGPQNLEKNLPEQIKEKPEHLRWSGRVDLNHRPPGPEPGALAKLSHAPMHFLYRYLRIRRQNRAVSLRGLILLG